MIVYSYYISDSRVRREAEALGERGDEVEVFCLKHHDQEMNKIRLNGVTVHRIQTRKINEKGPLKYLFKLIRFVCVSAINVTIHHFRKKFDVIHIHSVPDFLVFAAFIPKMMGVKVILDIHDLVPEFYARKFKLEESHRIVRLLKWIEKVSARFANHVLTVTEMWRQKIIDRSVADDKCTVLLNVPDTKIYRPVAQKRRKNNGFTLIYPGNLGEHWGVDIAIKALPMIKNQIPNVKLNIIGEGKVLDSLLQLTGELKLEDHVYFSKQAIPVEDVPEWIHNADVGIVPKRGSTFASEALSTKLLEFVAMGVPVVVSRTKASQTYFDDSMVMFFEPENEKDLARCVIDLYHSPAKRKELVHNANRFNEKHNWERYKNIYYNVIDGLCRN